MMFPVREEVGTGCGPASFHASPMFWSMNEKPIAVISGASRGWLRSTRRGRAATSAAHSWRPGRWRSGEGSSFNLFVDSGDGRRKRMLYRLFFTTPDGAPVTLSGFKNVADDPNYDVWGDTSTLFVRLLRGPCERGGRAPGRPSAR